MTKLNHNRDRLRYIDNCCREMEIDARRAAPLLFETIEGIPTKPHVFEKIKTVSPKQSRSAAGWVSPSIAASSLKTPSIALTTRTSFSKFKSRVGALGPSANEDIHVYACSVMAHVMTYRDTTRVSELIGAMPKSFRRRDLIDWFERYVPLKIAYATGKVTYVSKAASDEWKQFVDGFETTWKQAIDTPFWSVQCQEKSRGIIGKGPKGGQKGPSSIKLAGS